MNDLNSPQPFRAAVLLAAGSGTRLGANTNKVWLELGDRELAVWSFVWLQKTQLFDRYIAVVHPDEIEFAESVFKKHLSFDVEVIAGGSTRHESETKALLHLEDSILGGKCEMVLIHDAARPLTSPQLITELVNSATEFGGAIPYLETKKLVSDVDNIGNKLVRAQTPQVFQAKPLLDAYKLAKENNFQGTDTASCLEVYNSDLKVKAILGSAQNFKVTFAQDLVMARHILNSKDFDID